MIITDFNLFESLQPYQRCVIYFLSSKDKDGRKKLYVTISRSLIWNGKTYVAELTNDIYRVYKEDERFFIVKVEPLNDKVKKKMGISGNHLYLNENKTPLHKLSRKYDNIQTSLYALKDQIDLIDKKMKFENLGGLDLKYIQN